MDSMKVFATSFETVTASGTCRNRPRITGGTEGLISGSGEVVDGDVFRHSRGLSSCGSDGGITTKKTFIRPTVMMKQQTAFSKIIL